MRHELVPDGESAVLRVIDSPTLWVAVLVVAFIAYYFVKDIRSPEKAASNNILSGMVEHTGDVFAMAQESMAQARQAQQDALTAMQGAAKCEQQVTGLVMYVRQLTSQLEKEGIPPIPMPDSLQRLLD